MKIKVCGMRDPKNIRSIDALSIDYMGFIFYDNSPRYVRQLPSESHKIQSKKIGVFVNSSHKEILERVAEHELQLVQLHGNESAAFCRQLSQRGIAVIKAFRIDRSFDFKQIEAYQSVCSYFLFDAKGESYGGNGVQFDWRILEKYRLNKPYFLSGGIDLDSIDRLKNVHLPGLYAIDVNSKFEIEPGLKNIDLVSELCQKVALLKYT